MFLSWKYLFLLLIFAFVAAAGLGQSTAVYVESNRADHNSILAYRSDGGTLTFLGEFSTEGHSLPEGPDDTVPAFLRIL